MNLQAQLEGWLQSSGYSLIDNREGFVVGDRLGTGNVHDTCLFWVPRPPSQGEFEPLEAQLMDQIEAKAGQYPRAKSWVLLNSLEGFSRHFRQEARRFGCTLTVPALLFDSPFRVEEAPGYVSAISNLREFEVGKRVNQPYVKLVNGEWQDDGDDVLRVLLDQIQNITEPRVYIVVGAAGAGKTYMYKALFTVLYQRFIDDKKRHRIARRPIPLIPDYLRESGAVRTPDLIQSFLRTEVAATVSSDTFEWMLVHGYTTWMFDGLDELYASDENFFDYILDLITRTESKAHILICARDSLLSSNEPLVQLLEDFPPSPGNDLIEVFQLNDFTQASKRNFAWINLEGQLPKKNEKDTPRIKDFLTAISSSDALKRLSGLPYFCGLLLGDYTAGRLRETSTDFELMGHAVSGIIDREIDKGLINPAHLEEEGLHEWLQELALEFYEDNFVGLPTDRVRVYAEIITHEGISDEERQNTVTSLTQFPLFAPGTKPGLLVFKHELIAEYLAGRYLTKELKKNPARVARALGAKSDLAESLIARYIASQLAGDDEAISTIVRALQTEMLGEHGDANLLQLLLLADPARDLLKRYNISLEGRDLSGMRFSNLDMSGLCLRNCDLSFAVFQECDLRQAKFEGAHLSTTRFIHSSTDFLSEAQFGNLTNFESIYAGKQRIDEHKKMTAWLHKMTGLSERQLQPCPAAFQLRTLFRKYVNRNGSGRRDYLPLTALLRGKRHPEAPDPDDCVKACFRSGYLSEPDFRKWVKRVPGDTYNDIVVFVRDWRMTSRMRQTINSICTRRSCEHVPQVR